MDKKQKAILCINALKEEFPGAVCSLDYSDPLQLLIATRLSAQCTDARVNLVTPVLFKKYPDIDSLACADQNDVESIIHSCGFFRAKAHDIIAVCRELRDNYNGILPDSVDELIKLPGVGRKTANLIVGDVFKKPAVVADTHCIRISGLLGLASSKDPFKVEMELKSCLPPEESNDFCHRLVLHGRKTCIARHPNCSLCCLKSYCDHYNAEKGI
jgi:endonuclease-3